MVDTQITILVKLFGDLRKYMLRGAPDESPVTLHAGATIAELIAQLGIAPGEEVIPAINGAQARKDVPLRDGDRVMLLTPMEGG